ncbi:helix-turn-helix domain-containing protein [Romboutsia sp. 1001216sp1]|uniref:helix-turn-helix domain-containing protein n=1 Tax=Romboutsia sp. 1001216sp1 TaxID=2986997 RepID=UPI0023315089|nr:helix-turn-helix domain-containing protein [Romboutsia sp. 1001216sp1]MDB8803604.1 helix-turn-helix domain-containing protein [Romboutsia sp. 1001216sp1]MDB8807894.1 helix-turn-helix domain-containing protein [Romboutsia sp. 1001216sp1]MDB8809252.1 helix-turn-helix domain-containing protein [Romboutsia sp. 1001216sp1]MDB8815000.1 helix-turn-helix domain-containing protein [Romboutsia sp. 1001216sp1]MDB8819733.1 helix-turn-helix domain-containing protein [Romboutsia sp. 1001216sp1]
MNGLEYILSLYNMQHIELAEILGIKKQNINMWIKGKQNIPKKYLPVLEEIFNIDSKYFVKELNEIEKLEIQKEKLKQDLKPVIKKHEQKFSIGEINDIIEKPIYDKEEINSIERSIEKAKLIDRFKNSIDLVDDMPNMDTYKLIVELMEKVPHEIVFHKTIEALAHYYKVIPEWVNSSTEQEDFEEEIFEVFSSNEY